MMTRRRASKRRGFTLIEVMMALAVMITGAVAIMALHQATVRGNFEARQRTTATHIVTTWIERLRRDAVAWEVGGPNIAYSAANLSRTQYLRNVSTRGSVGSWTVPAPAVTTESAMFDHFGRDTRTATDRTFCTNLRLEWVYEGQAMRADVRVWYPRQATITANSATLTCGNGEVHDALTTRINDLHFVSGSTVLRWTPRSLAPGAGGP